MRVIRRSIVQNAHEKHADARAPLESWLNFVENEQWNSPIDLQRDFRNVTILPDNRAVFKIRGNRYRLIVQIDYVRKLIDIRFCDTHAEYNKINALTI